ncbi:unnamed protein product [Cyclocybe aegerita]|uniref:Uncharacterized protein n=1 Tax=Cyclocybe aegerita TaxID=1973307 RepID=A0A8S0W6C4_CYCAE|nr:unnamed protein product [Cyclocybe aegerita]
MATKSMLVFLLGCVGVVLADDDAEFVNDPYLAFRPAFARSLPVQIMLTGVVLTLVAVLFIHLMFTAQYHWPLAPVNYVLQLSGVTTLLISLIATIHVVLSATMAESEKWPYMLSYIAVNVPPLDLDNNTEGWSIAERATWLVMNASTSGLIQITHIQFLTLLYPSRLEGRLIFALLGPLAVVAAVMQLLPISGSTAANNIASAVRNVCNAALSLLFTIALFIWGLLVNRKQAWRTDGGTAVFGCAALSLAVVSTALNFLYVHKEEEFVWLPALMWAVVLWQSFLGWWWWVGAGSGGGFREDEDESMEEKLRREERREARRKEARERRRETKIRAQRVWKGVAGAFSTSAQSREPSVSQARVRARSNDENASESPSSPRRETTSSAPSEPSSSRSRDADTTSIASRASSSVTLTSQLTYTTLPRMLPTVFHRWYASLRRAHNDAARAQAVERVERIRELGRRDRRHAPPERERDSGEEEVTTSAETRTREEVVGWGWGLDGFGWRRRPTRRVEERRARAQGKERQRTDSESRSRSRTRLGSRRNRNGADADVDGGEYEMEVRSSGTSNGRRRRRRDDNPEEEEDDDMYVSDPASPTSRDEEEDDDDAHGRRRNQRRRTDHDRQESTVDSPLPAPSAANRPRSVWWWGPLARWRLQDSTTY